MLYVSFCPPKRLDRIEDAVVPRYPRPPRVTAAGCEYVGSKETEDTQAVLVRCMLDKESETTGQRENREPTVTDW